MIDLNIQEAIKKLYPPSLISNSKLMKHYDHGDRLKVSRFLVDSHDLYFPLAYPKFVVLYELKRMMCITINQGR